MTNSGKPSARSHLCHVLTLQPNVRIRILTGFSVGFLSRFEAVQPLITRVTHKRRNPDWASVSLSGIRRISFLDLPVDTMSMNGRRN